MHCLDNEADMVLSYTPSYHLIAGENDNFGAASFSDGHYIQIEVAAMLKSSSQPELAEKFLNFIITPAQNIIPTTNWMYPAFEAEVPNGFKTLIAPNKSLLFPPDEVAMKQAGLMDG